jgi:citrate lyase beta subunit
MLFTLTEEALAPAIVALSKANQEFDARYPGEAAARQPVHTVYGGAQRFRSDTVAKLGAIARDTLRTYIPDSSALASVTGMDAHVAGPVHARIAAKLEREPIEDFRIDFEDGYGVHTGAEEDTHATEAAVQLARAMEAGTLPPFIGIRVKSFSTALCGRAVRTLDLFLTALIGRTARLPGGFVLTLPKVTVAAQVSALHQILSRIEERFQLPPSSIPVEVMIETPQVLIGQRGVCAIPALIEAASGRCRGLHFGPYDYTSSLGITGSHQGLHHPACDFARNVMQASTAGTGVFLSDGPTKTIPLAPYRSPSLNDVQQAENRNAVHRAMRIHYDDVRRSLNRGFHQGWDLHPAQFPMRYAAVYAFFLEGAQAAAGRLRNFIGAAAQATTLGTVFDDAASAQGLLNFFLQGWSCGAFTESEIQSTGLTVDEVRRRSFAHIMEGRGA